MSDTVNLRQSTSATAPSSRYDLFVFGDSLSDIGRFFQATLQLFPPSPPYFDGRFSNGPVAVEYLSKELGLNLSLSTDFAIGGANSGTTNINDRPPLVFGGLQTQIANFRSQAAQLGANAEDLYVIWAGANDFLNLPPNPTPESLATIVANAVNNIAASVSSLAQAGARDIVVVQSPNLGIIPQVIQAGLQQTVSNLTAAFNTALATALSALEPILSGANIILTDLFPISNSVAQNPASFGFTTLNPGYLNSVQNPTPVIPGSNPDGFLFWDQVHPTTKAHALFSTVFEQSIISGITANLQRVGTPANNTVVGFSGEDFVLGLAGNDLLEGNPGNDILDGGQGNDRLVGGRGNDRLFGRAGRDRLTGIDLADPTLGQGERDNLNGGIDRDLFVLGNEQGAFYNDGAANRRGVRDYGRIDDLQRIDRIQLAGSLEDYVIRRMSGSPSSGVGIYLKTGQQQELIGVVANTSDIGFVTRAVRTVEITPATIS